MSNLVLKKLYYVDHEVANFFKTRGLLKVLLLLVLLAIMMIISILLFLSPKKHENLEALRLMQFLAREDKRFDDDAAATIREYQRIDEITAQVFYSEHVAPNVPFVLRNGSVSWPAYHNWKNESYLREKLEGNIISVRKRDASQKDFSRWKKGAEVVKMNYSAFLDLYQNEHDNKILYWGGDELPDNLFSDVVEPDFAQFMELDSLHVWQVQLNSIFPKMPNVF